MHRLVPFTGSRPRFIGPVMGAALTGAALLGLAALAAAEPHSRRGPEFPISVTQAKDRAEARFQKLDADGSGEISPQELSAAGGLGGHHGPGFRGHAAMAGHRGPGRRPDAEQRGEWHRQHQADREAMDAALFERLDENGDGKLTAGEFSMEKMHDAARATLQERMFAHLDRDGSGGLSRDELPGMARHLAAMDTDGDGTVTRQEARDYHQARRQAAERQDADG